MVRISACHVEGPGSIPGRGVIILSLLRSLHPSLPIEGSQMGKRTKFLVKVLNFDRKVFDQIGTYV